MRYAQQVSQQAPDLNIQATLHSLNVSVNITTLEKLSLHQLQYALNISHLCFTRVRVTLLLIRQGQHFHSLSNSLMSMMLTLVNTLLQDSL